MRQVEREGGKVFFLQVEMSLGFVLGSWGVVRREQLGRSGRCTQVRGGRAEVARCAINETSDVAFDSEVLKPVSVLIVVAPLYVSSCCFLVSSCFSSPSFGISFSLILGGCGAHNVVLPPNFFSSLSSCFSLHTSCATVVGRLSFGTLLATIWFSGDREQNRENITR